MLPRSSLYTINHTITIFPFRAKPPLPVFVWLYDPALLYFVPSFSLQFEGHYETADEIKAVTLTAVGLFWTCLSRQLL